MNNVCFVFYININVWVISFSVFKKRSFKLTKAAFI